MKKEEEIKAILTKNPKERTKEERELLSRWNRECTTEERESLNKWRAENLTEEEKAQLNKMVNSVGRTIEHLSKKLGIDKLPPKERSEALIKHFKEAEKKERALKAKEKELEKRKKELTQRGSYRKPKHLVNATTGVRPIKDKEVSLFSGLDETIATFKTPPMLGLELTRGERKLVNCFSLLLQERSQTLDAKETNYFTGDTDRPQLERYSKKNNDVIAPRPELRTTLYELTKVYTRKANPSGREMTLVRGLLNTLKDKTYYVVLSPIEYKDEAGEPKRIEWSGRVTLFMIGRDLDSNDKNELYIQLSSIFALQIRDYYVNYPIDFDAQVEEASLKLNDSKRVGNGIYIFIDYLASNRGAKGIYKHEIYKSNLYEKISYKWLKDSRISMLDENIKKGIEIALEIGLLEKWEEVIGATGEKKYIFYTSKSWIK